MKKSMISNQNLLSFIAKNFHLHSHTTDWWKTYSKLIESDIKKVNTPATDSFTFGEIGLLNFPFVSFGNRDTTNLFNLDEIIIFSWYLKNKKKYTKVLDLGANVGLHSLIMSKIGFLVDAYEPDPVHFKLLEDVILKNPPMDQRILLHQQAVSNVSGKQEFIQMLDNTTGSHILNAKPTVYGRLNKILVESVTIDSVFKKNFDFVKMDVEGSEIILLSSLAKENIQNTEFMIEIGNSKNAESLLVEIDRLGLNAFSQKNNWAQVRDLEDIPKSHREGSIFLTSKSEMDWT